MVRAWWIAGLLLTAGACRASLPPPGGPAPVVPTPEEARERARRTDDPVAAADLAWVAGNDRAYAKARLEDALILRPANAEALLRRGLLALGDLDMPGARDWLSRTVSAAPDSPESGIALVALHSWTDELVAQSSTLTRSLLATGLVDPARPAAPFHRAIASAVMMNLDGAPSQARLRRVGGWLSQARVVGPLGPVHDRVLLEPQPLEDAIDWSPRPPFRGVVPPVRVIRSQRSRLVVPAGGRRGTYLMQAFFRMAEAREGILQARLPASGREKIDGFEVHTREAAGARPPKLKARRHSQERGGQLISLVVTAVGRDTVALSLLDDDGKPMTDDERPAPPAAPLVAKAPDLGPSGVAAYRGAHPYWLAGTRPATAERAIFARLTAATAALSPWVDDLETGRAYLYGLQTAASESAAVWAARARLAAWSRLPGSVVESHLREALAKDPTHVGLLVGLGRRTVRDDETRALDLADRAIASAPEAFAAWALAFDVFERQSWHAEAMNALLRAQTYGAPPRILLDGSRYLRRTGQVAAAEAMANVALERASVMRRTMRAQQTAQRGDLAGAIAALGEGTLPLPDQLRKAEWALAQGDLDLATRTARAILEDDPLQERAVRIVAMAAAARGDLETARSALDGLRRMGETSPAQEALAESFGGPPVAGPPERSWLAERLGFEPLPFIAPLAGARQPRGLDPSDRWAGHGKVQVLDRIVDRVQLDGSTITLRHSVVRLQTQEARDQVREIRLPPSALTLRLRTLKPDGTTVEVDRYAGKSDLSFSALSPGDAVEQKWVAVDRPATPWGGYVRRFYFQSTAPTIRGELAVIVPRGVKVDHFSYNGAPQPIVHEDDNEVVYYWRTDEISPVVPEPQSPHPTEYVPFVVVSVGVDRELALETRSLQTRRQTRGSYDIERATAGVVRGANTDEAKLMAIFNWLVDKIGHGNATEPTQVLVQGRGDRTGLFAAMLNAAGISAEVVRARTGRAPVVAPSYPNLREFPNTLVRVTLAHDGARPAEGSARVATEGKEASPRQVLWADMARQSPWLGRLSPWYQEGHYLTRSTDGRPVVRPILPRDIASWPIESQLSLKVGRSGDASGTLRIEVPGTTGVDLARLLAAARPDEQKRQLQRWLASIMPSAQLQRLSITERRTPLSPLVLTASVAIPGFMATDRDHLVAERFFSTPLIGEALGQPGLATYLRLPRRETPLLISPTFERSTVIVDFPDDVARPVEAPRSFRRSATFGRIEQSFVWDDDAKRARLDRQRLMPLKRIPASEFPAFRDNAQVILQAGRNRLIVPLSAPTTTARATTRD